MSAVALALLALLLVIAIVVAIGDTHHRGSAIAHLAVTLARKAIAALAASA